MPQRNETWRIGRSAVTSAVEQQFDGIPPAMFFPSASEQATKSIDWLGPDAVGNDGSIGFCVRALLVRMPGLSAVVDPCVGSGRTRRLPFWNDQQFPWLESLEAAGVAAADVDLVVHTHLHADHVGWGTHRREGSWIPTFPNARYVYVEQEVEHWWAEADGDAPEIFVDSIEPIVTAGLAELVGPATPLDEGLRLISTPGHTPGHVSVEIQSAGEKAVITGDLVHHPVQLAYPDWSEVADSDADLARRTRRRFLQAQAGDNGLVLGTHFPGSPAGRVIADGEAWRFQPEPASE